MTRLLILMLACLAWTGAQALTLDENTQRTDLTPAIEVLEDPSGTLRFEDVSSPEFSARFARWTGTGSVNFGYTASAVWLRVELARTPDAGADWRIVVPYTQLNTLSFHVPGQPSVETGSERPVSSRPFFDRFFVFPVTLDTQPRLLYLRATSTNSLSIPMEIASPEQLNADTQRTLLIQGIYHGGLAGLLAYNLFLWLTLRDRRFLLYSLFALHLGAGMLAGNGFGRLFVWPDSPAFDGIAQNLLLAMACGYGALFSDRFLGLRVDAPVLSRLMRASAAIVLVNAALMLVTIGWPALSPRTVTIWLTVTVPVSGLLTLWASARALRRDARGAAFFCAAWSMLWLGVFGAVLRSLGWLPGNDVTAYSLQIGSAAEMVLLALALADMLRRERDAREAAQAGALAANAARLEASRASEERLERIVGERTGQLERALRQEKQSLSQYIRFGSMISHEFRNPLSILSSQLSLLRREHAEGVDQVERRIEAMSGATRRLTTMFEKWLQNDRLGQFLSDLAPHSVRLSPWLTHIVDANSGLLERHRVALRIDPSVTELEADEYLLEIAVTNLLENAVRYSPAGSRITIATRGRTGFAGVAVSDEGIGIAPEHQDAVFSEFFRAAPEGAVRGMGLGLAIVRRIVEAHGGTVELDSLPGQGSTFCLWLPIDVTPRAGGAPLPAPLAEVTGEIPPLEPSGARACPAP
ncbi:MAG: hypothetical protein RIS35_2714 [Pseudomonadota bacterium]|jgi:signal transduction histidine kinase